MSIWVNSKLKLNTSQTPHVQLSSLTEDLLQEVEHQLSMGVDNLSEEDRWMLELDVDQLSSFSLAEKKMWIHAVEAARQASTRAMELSVIRGGYQQLE